MAQLVTADSIERLDDDLAARELKGFWRYALDEDVPFPRTTVRPYLWRWQSVYDGLTRAGEVVSLEQSERRVIALVNPGMEERRFTSHTLQLTAQYVKPGERARAHRHTIAAFRFVVRGRGAYTTVNGQQCSMAPGDLILTPGLTWHDHTNESDEPIVWLDGLDTPVIRALQQLVFQPYQQPYQAVQTTSGDVRQAFGAAPASAPPDVAFLHFAWQDAHAALRAQVRQGTPGWDGYAYEYRDPRTGGPTLPTMQCALHWLTPDQQTPLHRHTSTAIYHVVRGQGETLIGDQRFAWEAGDSFVVPLWYAHQHRNASATQEAILFSFSDTPLLSALGLLREEQVA